MSCCWSFRLILTFQHYRQSYSECLHVNNFVHCSNYFLHIFLEVELLCKLFKVIVLPKMAFRKGIPVYTFKNMSTYFFHILDRWIIHHLNFISLISTESQHFSIYWSFSFVPLEIAICILPIFLLGYFPFISLIYRSPLYIKNVDPLSYCATFSLTLRLFSS